jgi:hypothetical protein
MTKNFMLIQGTFLTVVSAAKKFSGFEMPSGVTENAELAASELEAGKVEEAEHVLREAHTELARTLRAFINHSPSFFAAQLAAMKGLDIGLKQRLNLAIMRYSRDVKGAGWEPAARMYNTVAGLVAGAPSASERIKAEKAAEIRRRMDAADEAVAKAEKAQADKKAAVEEAARRQAAEELRRMVVRKVA